MNVKDVIKLCAMLLGKDELLSYTVLDGAVVLIPETQQKEIDAMLRCYNLCNMTISAEYLPLVAKESVTVTNGELSLSDLTNTLVDIKQITDTSGRKVLWRGYATYISLPNGTYDVEYSYLASKKIISDSADTYFGKIDERIMAYGTAMEYSLISEGYDEALVWEKRFKDALMSACRKKHEAKLKKRGWF